MSDKTEWKHKKGKSKRSRPNRDHEAIPSNFTQDPLDTIEVENHSSNTNHVDIGEDNHGLEGFDINNPPDIDADVGGQVMSQIEDILKRILAIAFYPLCSMSKFTRFCSDWICRAFSNGEPSIEDEKIVSDNILRVLLYFVSIYVFYNWFFILCFREDKRPTPTFEISWLKLREKSAVASLFFKYVVCQVSFVNAIMMKIKEYSHLLDRRLAMIFLFLATIQLVTTSSFSIMQMLYDAVEMKTNDTLGGMLIGYAFLFAIYTFASEPAETNIAKFSSVVSAIGTFILFVMRMIFTFLIIWVAALLIALYFISYSLFGIFMFSKTSFMTTIQRMDAWIISGMDDPPSDKYSLCRPRTWIEFIVETSRWILKTFIKYFFEFVLVFTLGEVIRDYYRITDHDTLRDILVSLTWLLIIGVLGYVYNKAVRSVVIADPEVVAKVKSAFGVTKASEGGSDEFQTAVPIKGTVTEPPIEGTIAEPPLEGTMAEPPIEGAIAEPPIEGTIAEPPIEGTIAEPPIEGTIAEPPIESTIAEPPIQLLKEGTIATEPITQLPIQQFKGGEAKNQEYILPLQPHM
jgi:ABC-type multidrug transport system fused ATPase/permease subunit